MSVVALFVFAVLSVSLVSAFVPGQDIVIDRVEVNNVLLDKNANEADFNLDNANSLIVEEGEELEVEVLVKAIGFNAESVRVTAEISGYEYDDYEEVRARTHVFDLDGFVEGQENAEATKRVRLNLQMPNRLEDDRYLLRITVDDKDSSSLVQNYVLQIEPARHALSIRDVYFSPGSTVEAGRSLRGTVLLDNFGDRDQKDVVVRMEVPAWGVSAVEVVDEVETDNHNFDHEDVPEMFLAVPANTAEGEYQVVVTAQYDDLRESVSKTYTVHVNANPRFQAAQNGQSVLVSVPQARTIAQGATGSFAIALSNDGFTSRAYTLQAVSTEAVSATASQNLVVLEPGQNAVVRVDVTPESFAPVGEHVVSVVVSSGNEAIETVMFTANVAPATEGSTGSTGLAKGLEIALIVLIVLLVIIGLIIGFSRLRKDEEDEEQTYY